MKGTSRPHPTSFSRPAPYRKRKQLGRTSPIHSARRAPDACHAQSQISPHARDLTHGTLRRHETQPRAISLADDDRRPLPKTGEPHNVSQARSNPRADDGLHERQAHVKTLPSAHPEVPGPPLRLPFISSPFDASAFVGKRKAESPPPDSVTAFLRSIELPDKPSSVPSCQASLPVMPPSLRLPSLSTECTNKAACSNESDYQVNLVYKGYPFTYDLSTLPDDPKGTIALLTITKSDPGAYILVGAHYRRTGRSGAACAVIRSLLDSLDDWSDAANGNGDAAATTASDTSTATSPTSRAFCPKLTDRFAMPVSKSAAVRPALLLLAACELDVSRERPDDPESEDHASTAHELFRAVYGVVNDAVIAGAARPESKCPLGLEFSGNGSCSSISSSEASRVESLEKELCAVRSAQKILQGKLEVSNGCLADAEDKVRILESRSREMLLQLDASRDENWELRQRLAESEPRERELVQCSPSVESRVWGRLKDLLFDNLGVRSE